MIIRQTAHISDFQNKIIYYKSSRGYPFSTAAIVSSLINVLPFPGLQNWSKRASVFIDLRGYHIGKVCKPHRVIHFSHSMAIWTCQKEHDRGKANFHFEVTADLLNEEMELIASMRPGLISWEIGISPPIRRTITEIRRKMNFEEVKRIVKSAGKGNVHQHLDLIAGLPYEDYQAFCTDVFVMSMPLHRSSSAWILKVLKGSICMKKTERLSAFIYQDRPPFEVLSTK